MTAPLMPSASRPVPHQCIWRVSPALPRDQADVARFDAEIRTAKRAGADIVRTVMLSGRRYESFASMAAFRRFAESSFHSLTLAAPVAARHDVRLAVENHKDWRADELIAILKRVGNDHLGVCVDTGNSIARIGRSDGSCRCARPVGVHHSSQGHGARGRPPGFPPGRGLARDGHPRAAPAALHCARPDQRFVSTSR